MKFSSMLGVIYTFYASAYADKIVWLIKIGF